eukprot:TRINITY_DN72312_c0_g1_i1.p1 TRINITY_DN72312_c0_g1~~TRINITY_DN72312_c0_g1_i1.p1  ORF type:complete len:244 (+),score=50.88 TRINITY_DN72312_c0_g1_i1:42-734(+)
MDFWFADVLELVEHGATLCALFFLLSPLPLVLQVHLSRGERLSAVNPAVVLSMYANCGLQVIYGVYLPMPPAVPANVVGLSASCVYLVVCWCWALRRRQAPWGALAALATACTTMFLLTLLAYAAAVADGAAHVGYFAMVVNIVMYAAPLSAVAQVFRERRSNMLPRLQCLLGLVCSSLWLAVGVSRGSAPIAVPNLAGVLLSLLQLALICWFPVRGKAAAYDGIELMTT